MMQRIMQVLIHFHFRVMFIVMSSGSSAGSFDGNAHHLRLRGAMILSDG